MFSTEELRRYIILQIDSKFGKVDWSKIHFEKGGDSSIEGIYVFAEKGKYHFLFTEKGKIRSDIIAKEVQEILLNVVEVFSFDIAIEYAMREHIEGQDFRRRLFQKEIENYSLFGEEFRRMKENEIREILKNNPYKDS